MNGKVHYWIVCDAVAYIKLWHTFTKEGLAVFRISLWPTKINRGDSGFSERNGRD